MRSYANPYAEGTQPHRILEHLMSKGSITQVEAEAVYKIRRLASRIHELSRFGWNIGRELKSDAMGQRYARYFLKKPYLRY
jgi:hypothetical protein